MVLRNLYLNGGSSFDTHYHGQWLRQHWWVSIFISLAYIFIIFGGKRLMSDRKPFDLRRPLVAWSGSFALFSFAGAVVLVRDFARCVVEDGWRATICDANFFNGNVGLWFWLFALSKVLELGDTIFIVLRKQKLIFIHWYHHVTTLVYTCYLHADFMSVGRYFATLNFVVHFVMYSYYALSAAKIINKPRQIKISITVIQLVQFVISIGVSLYAAFELSAGRQCDINWLNIFWTMVLYVSFLYYFLKFFHDAYVKRPEKQKI
ncbi:very long chain fatty acid elongase 6-like [Lytechinus pictus]|uniref:very long chain fatty acid elongase 6-like n=1 Tax=Lytechinus pictus TaxID=7653 RepID=UPI0030B9F02B